MLPVDVAITVKGPAALVARSSTTVSPTPRPAEVVEKVNDGPNAPVRSAVRTICAPTALAGTLKSMFTSSM